MDSLLPYYLGAPLWSVQQWRGGFYAKNTSNSAFLHQYAQFFNAVEGNTTFYAVPSAEMVQRWCDATPLTFRFAFKLPRSITHEAKLQHCQPEMEAFLLRMSPLGKRLQAFMIQLPASFTPSMLPILAHFLAALPSEFRYAVEVRHPAFFIQASQRQALQVLLQEYAVDRIIFDSRAVHAAPPLDAATMEAQQRKPRLPVQLDCSADWPVLRYIGHPVLVENERWLLPWVAQTVRWIEAGKVPRIFLHTPDNYLVPQLALWFHQQLQQRLAGLSDLPPFPVQRGQGELY